MGDKTVATKCGCGVQICDLRFLIPSKLDALVRRRQRCVVSKRCAQLPPGLEWALLEQCGEYDIYGPGPG